MKDTNYDFNIDKDLKELSKFFGFELKSKPKLHFFYSRVEIDKHQKRKTEDFIVGWINNKDVFYLHPSLWEKYSCHKNPKISEWKFRIKHELAHLYYGKLVNYNFYTMPVWLWEGVSGYFGEIPGKLYSKPNKLIKFLNYGAKHNEYTYVHGAYFVNALVKHYGSKKLIELIKNSIKCKTSKEFKSLFKSIYGFALTYNNANELFKKNN